jgi:hypothetical protein
MAKKVLNGDDLMAMFAKNLRAGSQVEGEPGQRRVSRKAANALADKVEKDLKVKKAAKAKKPAAKKPATKKPAAKKTTKSKKGA